MLLFHNDIKVRNDNPFGPFHLGSFIKYLRTNRGREGHFSVHFLRTPIVFGFFFHCSSTYTEGGRVKNLDIFAYVLNEWSLYSICLRTAYHCFMVDTHMMVSQPILRVILLLHYSHLPYKRGVRLLETPKFFDPPAL